MAATTPRRAFIVWCAVLLGASSLVAVNASTLRTGADRARARALGDVRTLADKYGCHMEKGDLSATLSEVERKNSLFSSAMAKNCSREQAQAEANYQAAVTRASEAHAAADKKAQDELMRATEAAANAFDATMAAAGKAVDDAKLAETAADKALTAADGSYQGAVADHARVTTACGNERSVANATLLRAMQKAADVRREGEDEADSVYATAMADASTARAEHKTTVCQATFKRTRDALDGDEETVRKVKDLVARLNLCKEESRRVVLLKTPTRELAAAADAGKPLVLLEEQQAAERAAYAARCSQMRDEVSQLMRFRASPEAVDATRDTAITGGVDDMERRLADGRQEAIKRLAACESAGDEVFNKASTAAVKAKDAARTKVATTYQKGVAVAQGAHDTAVAGIKGRERASAVALEKATSARDEAESALTIARQATTTQYELQEKTRVSATAIRQKAGAAAAADFDAAKKVASSAAKQMKDEALTAKTAAAAAIKTACDKSQATLAHEMVVVAGIRDKLGLLKVIAEPTTSAQR